MISYLQTSPPSIFIHPKPRIDGRHYHIEGTHAVIYNGSRLPMAYVVRERSDGQPLPQLESGSVEVVLHCTGRQKVVLEKVLKSLETHGVALEKVPEHLWAVLGVRLYDSKFTVGEFWKLCRLWGGPVKRDLEQTSQ